jgi:hypothetical protein
MFPLLDQRCEVGLGKICTCSIRDDRISSAIFFPFDRCSCEYLGEETFTHSARLSSHHIYINSRVSQQKLQVEMHL